MEHFHANTEQRRTTLENVLQRHPLSLHDRVRVCGVLGWRAPDHGRLVWLARARTRLLALSQDISAPGERFVEVDALDDLQAMLRDARLLEPLSHGALENTFVIKATLGEARVAAPVLAQANVRQEAALATPRLTEGYDTCASRRLALESAFALNGWRVWPLDTDLSTRLLQRQCC